MMDVPYFCEIFFPMVGFSILLSVLTQCLIKDCTEKAMLASFIKSWVIGIALGIATMNLIYFAAYVILRDMLLLGEYDNPLSRLGSLVISIAIIFVLCVYHTTTFV